MKKIIYSTFIFFLFVTQVFAQDAMYIHLKNRVEKFLIADIDSVKFEETTVTQYNYFISKNASSGFIHYSTTIPTINAASDFNIVYNSTTPINLNDLVLATASNGVVEKTFADYGLGTVGVNYQFVFSNSFAYTGMDGVTNQNSFISIQSDGSITIVGGTSAIDRTPVLKVELKSSAGTLLAQAYIKFKIITSTTPPSPVSREYRMADLNYASLFKGVNGVDKNITDFGINWEQMNEILSALGITYNEFRNVYGYSPVIEVKVNGIVVPDASLSKYPLVNSNSGPTIDTYAMKHQITPLAKFGRTSVKYTITPAFSNYPVLNITFNYSITKPILDKSILPAYQYGSATALMTQGMNTAGGYKMQMYLGEAFGFGTANYRNAFGAGVANKIDGASHYFMFNPYVPDQTGASITSTSNTLDGCLGSVNSPTSGTLLSMTTSLNESSKGYSIHFVTAFPNGEKDSFEFMAYFKNPITIESTPGSDITLTDFINGTCDEQHVALSNSVKVKFLGQDIIVNGVATAKAADYSLSASNYSLGITKNPLFEYGINLLNPNAAMSAIMWCNFGTKLTEKVLVGTIDASFNSSFVKLSNTIHKVYVQPEDNVQ